MTNYESIEPDKVKNVFARSFAVNKKTGEVLKCEHLSCELCLFFGGACGENRLKWLDQPAFDPEKDIDWEKVPVDTPVLVRQNNKGKEFRRYFCKIRYAESLIFRTFANGKTSWNADKEEYSDWEQCKLYRPEDVEKYRKKEADAEKPAEKTELSALEELLFERTHLRDVQRHTTLSAISLSRYNNLHSLIIDADLKEKYNFWKAVNGYE